MIPKVLRSFALLALATVLPGAALSAQSAQQPAPPETPLKVDVVLSRHQGTAVTSSLPFTLMVTGGGRGQRVSLRMGVDVPIGTTTTSAVRGTSTETTTTTSRPEYRHVGTAIDAAAYQLPDGRFRVYISAQDSSIYGAGGDSAQAIRSPDAMAFRTFSLSNELAMAIGETKQFAVATDRVSGEVIKLDVTLSAVK